jgi:hypothetical protein
MSRDYRWIWVPTINFFGGVVGLVEGIVTQSRGCVAVGVIIMLLCLWSILMMYVGGERWL